jgi:hypothetical protein
MSPTRRRQVPLPTRHGELTHISGLMFLAIRSVGATGYLGGDRFPHSDVAYRDFSCWSVYEYKRNFVRVHNIGYYKGPQSIHTVEKVDSSDSMVCFSPGLGR